MQQASPAPAAPNTQVVLESSAPAHAPGHGPVYVDVRDVDVGHVADWREVAALAPPARVAAAVGVLPVAVWGRGCGCR
jgi:hypothetical protein